MPEIIDAHTHIFPDDVASRAVETLHDMWGAQPVRLPVASELIAEMDEAGVDRSVIAPVSTKPSQVRSINDFVIGLAGERIIPFGSVHPHFDELEDELRRLEAADVRGLKAQPFFQGYDFADPRAREMFDLIGDRFALLIHGGQEIVDIEGVVPTPLALAALHRDFPKLRLIVAHMGGYNMWEAVEEHLVGVDVHFDLSYTFNYAPDDLVRELCAAHGWERCIFGSDFPWQGQAEALAGLRRMGLDDETLSGVLAGNLKRLLAID